MSARTSTAAGALITVDWGTSNFRAALLDAQGTIVDQIEREQGILRLTRDAMAQAYHDLLSPWLDSQPGVPVIMAGMVGSIDGLVEVPYLACPTDLDGLAENMVMVTDVDPDRPVFIVPGLSGRSVAGSYDVMRGEEVQIVGALAALENEDSAVFCLPGTHSKWVDVEKSCVTRFSTSMTGDVYAALREHSILARTIDGDARDLAVFEQGLARAVQPGGLLHHLFSARSDVLLGDLTEARAGTYLSGLLIGHEVAAMLKIVDPGLPLFVIGGRALTDLYVHAIEHAGREARYIDGGAAVHRGMCRLADLAGLDVLDSATGDLS